MNCHLRHRERFSWHAPHAKLSVKQIDVIRAGFSHHGGGGFNLSVRRAAAPSTAPESAMPWKLEIGPVLAACSNCPRDHLNKSSSTPK